MARPKGKTTTPTLNSSHATASIAKKFGDGVIINGRSIIDNPREVVSVSPALDAALGGGFQVGSLVVLAGKARSGKTTTALHFAGRWQSMGRRVVYLNAENRLGERDLTGIPNLKPDEFLVVQSCRGKVLTTQDYLSIAYTFLSEETDLLIIIDSMSILSEEREIIGGIGTETRGGSGKIMAQFCRLATPIIPINNHIVIGIAQVYANTSGFGKKYLVSMGSKADYALYTFLHCEYFEEWRVGSDESKEQIGQISHWRVERSPISKPGEKANSYIRYGMGIDEVQEYLQFADDLSLIDKSGSWYSYPKENPIVKGQGAEKFRQALLDNPEAWADLQCRIKEMVA